MHLKNIVETNKVKSGYVYVSTADTFDAGLETMVFECDKSGDVSDWGDLDYDRYNDLNEASDGHKMMVAKWGKLAPFA